MLEFGKCLYLQFNLHKHTCINFFAIINVPLSTDVPSGFMKFHGFSKQQFIACNLLSGIAIINRIETA